MTSSDNQAIQLRFSKKSSLIVTIVVFVFILAAFSTAVQKVSATSNQPLWTYNGEVGHQIWYSPTIVNDIFYVGTVDGYVYAINSTTNQPLWGPISTGDSFSSSPTVVNGVVYLAGYHGILYAFNASQTSPAKQQLWNYTVNDLFYGSPDLFYGSPVVSDGIVYLAGSHGGVYAFPASSNCPNWPLWSYQAIDNFTGYPTVCNFVGSPSLLMV